ncbi:MAG TPA: hypothetical protein VJ001_18255 [Rhodocyclaceae bacterium]|nr:hypothetical protein [Rhodocyclaceae bacterium]
MNLEKAVVHERHEKHENNQRLVRPLAITRRVNTFLVQHFVFVRVFRDFRG